MANRCVKVITLVVISILIFLLLFLFFEFRTIIKAASSVRMLEEDLYYIEFYGDYGFDKFLSKGGASSDSDVASFLTSYLSHGFYKQDIKTGDFGCSTIYKMDDNGSYIFGRNYDWSDCKVMICYTKPKDGYESFSTCCLDFLGFGDTYSPTNSVLERVQSLASIYVPLDGFNSQGLVVADLIAGDDEVTHQDSGKVNLTTTTAIRMILDKASTTEEALEILRGVDMHSSIDSAHHLAIADRYGSSVVVEYIDGQMVVTKTDIVTNHYIANCEKQGVGSKQSHIRFDSLNENKSQLNVKELLQSVSQDKFPQSGDYERTIWSIVYSLDKMCASFYFKENFDNSYALCF